MQGVVSIDSRVLLLHGAVCRSCGGCSSTDGFQVRLHSRGKGSRVNGRRGSSGGGCFVVGLDCGIDVVLVHCENSFLIFAVKVESGRIPCPCDSDNGKVVYPDVGLNGIVMLAVPFAGLLDEVVKISEGKLTQTAGLDRINIVNDDLSADGFAVAVALC